MIGSMTPVPGTHPRVPMEPQWSRMLNLKFLTPRVALGRTLSTSGLQCSASQVLGLQLLDCQALITSYLA